jgi:peptidoglycan/LPS O-acetylase OafA/YrhL
MNASSKFVRYALGGLLIGGFWYLNKGRPAWEEVIRTVIVFSILMVVLRMRLRRTGVDVHLVPLIATKAALVVLAAVVEEALKHHAVSNSALIVSVGLGVAVFLAGFLADSHFFSLIPKQPNGYAPAGHR